MILLAKSSNGTQTRQGQGQAESGWVRVDLESSGDSEGYEGVIGVPPCQARLADDGEGQQSVGLKALF